jgi:esterase/lipase superfamily enzyme
VAEHKLDVLSQHCADIGRDPAEIENTILAVSSDPLTDVDGFLASMEQYARLGVDLVEVVPRSSDRVAEVTRLGEEVVPRLGELSAPNRLRPEPPTRLLHRATRASRQMRRRLALGTNLERVG